MGRYNGLNHRKRPKNKWREGVGVEPTRDGFAPHTGFEDQEAHRNLYLPVFVQNTLVTLTLCQADTVKILQNGLSVLT